MTIVVFNEKADEVLKKDKAITIKLPTICDPKQRHCCGPQWPNVINVFLSEFQQLETPTKILEAPKSFSVALVSFLAKTLCFLFKEMQFYRKIYTKRAG